MGESTSRETAIAHDLDIVRVVVHDALHEAFHMNADPYEDESLRFAVAFPSGEIVEVQVGTSRREHEAALAEANKRARWWMSRTAECEVDISLLRDRLADAAHSARVERATALAETQHPSTPDAGNMQALAMDEAAASWQHPSTPGGTE